MTKNKKTNTTKYWQGYGPTETLIWVCTLLGNPLAVSTKAENLHPFDPLVPLLGINPTEMHIHAH